MIAGRGEMSATLKRRKFQVLPEDLNQQESSMAAAKKKAPKKKSMKK